VSAFSLRAFFSGAFKQISLDQSYVRDRFSCRWSFPSALLAEILTERTGSALRIWRPRGEKRSLVIRVPEREASYDHRFRVLRLV